MKYIFGSCTWISISKTTWLKSSRCLWHWECTCYCVKIVYYSYYIISVLKMIFFLSLYKTIIKILIIKWFSWLLLRFISIFIVFFHFELIVSTNINIHLNDSCVDEMWLFIIYRVFSKNIIFYYLIFYIWPFKLKSIKSI